MLSGRGRKGRRGGWGGVEGGGEGGEGGRWRGEEREVVWSGVCCTLRPFLTLLRPSQK